MPAVLSRPPLPSSPQKFTLTNRQKFLLQEFKAKNPHLAALNAPQHVKHPEYKDLEEPIHLKNQPPLPDSHWPLYFEQYCTDVCLLRYLRATNWQVELAYQRLIQTLRWRRFYQPDRIRIQDIQEEAKCGKIYFNNFDTRQRPILYLRNYKNDSKDYCRNIMYLIYNLELATTHLLPSDGKVEGNEVEMLPDQITLLFDFTRFEHKNSPPMYVSRYFLHLFGEYYPERMGTSLCWKAPWYFWAFFKIISPFIHPVTKEKIRFVNDKKEWKDYIEEERLEKEFGGLYDYEYNHEEYWQQLEQLASKQLPKEE